MICTPFESMHSRRTSLKSCSVMFFDNVGMCPAYMERTLLNARGRTQEVCALRCHPPFIWINSRAVGDDAKGGQRPYHKHSSQSGRASWIPPSIASACCMSSAFNPRWNHKVLHLYFHPSKLNTASTAGALIIDPRTHTEICFSFFFCM